MRHVLVALLTLIGYFVAAIISSGYGGKGGVWAKDDYYSFERVSNSLDDGTKHIDEIRETSVDSNDPMRPMKTHLAKIVEPSRFVHHKNNEIIGSTELHQQQNYPHHQQQQVIAPFELSPAERAAFISMPRDQMKKQFMASLASHGGFRRGFLTRPRTVEPPALSVDSGGRSSTSSRLANSIAKAFNVKQGYYSDIYSRLDRHEPLPNIVKRPDGDG